VGTLGLAPFWAILVSMTLSGAGMGTAAPAANNAGIALLPRQAAAIAGLRAMIRSLGGVLGQGLIVVIMEFAPCWSPAGEPLFHLARQARPAITTPLGSR
jgi:hypothetical protein